MLSWPDFFRCWKYFRPPKMFTMLRLLHLILFQVEDQTSVQLLSRLSFMLQLECLSLEFEDLNCPTSNGRCCGSLS